MPRYIVFLSCFDSPVVERGLSTHFSQGPAGIVKYDTVGYSTYRGVTTILSLQVCRIRSHNALKAMQEKDYARRQEHVGLNTRGRKYKPVKWRSIWVCFIRRVLWPFASLPLGRALILLVL
jgi:hypothetical protein